MKNNLWLNLLNGPIYVDRARVESSIEDGSITAIDLLRNIRWLNGHIDFEKLGKAISNCRAPEKVPPYVYYLAEKGVPHFRQELSDLMILSLPQRTISGITAILVDVSQDMGRVVVPGLTEIEMAAVWAMALPCEGKGLFTVSNALQQVAPAVGLGAVDRIIMSQYHLNCNIIAASERICEFGNFDRLVIITNKILPRLSAPAYVHQISPAHAGFNVFNLDRVESLVALRTGTVN